MYWLLQVVVLVDLDILLAVVARVDCEVQQINQLQLEQVIR
jgi:hypothetical protein